jgi:uncharacterized protein YecE (DUF72 family)
VPRALWLRHASRLFNTIELNGTFYSLKSPAVYRHWLAQAPEDDFVFAVKGSRYITHLRRLKDPRQGLSNFYASGVLALGCRTGPFLWQLPPRFRFDAPRLERFLGSLPRDSSEAEALAREHDRRLPSRALLRSAVHVSYRHAFEVRDPSFRNPEFYALLRGFGAALVVADTGGRFPFVEEPTADFMYARLHGPRELYASGYSDAELERWAERVRTWARPPRSQDVYVYFDNDAKAHAPFDALSLARRLAEASTAEHVAKGGGRPRQTRQGDPGAPAAARGQQKQAEP